MRKAIRFCLALALVGAMAAGTAFAGETEAKIWGDGYVYFKSLTAEHEDAGLSYAKIDGFYEAYMYMQGVNKGDVWTTKAQSGIYVYNGEVGVDSSNVYIYNDEYLFRAGSSDLGDATKNPSYFWGDKMDAGDELWKGGLYVKFGLRKVGLEVLFGTENDDNVQTVAYAVSYDKKIDDIDFSVEYETYSKAINEDVGASTTDDAGDDKDGINDGAVGDNLGFGVAYDMDPFAIKFNYDMKSETPGGPGAEADEETSMMLSGDYKLDDVSGVSVVYQQIDTDQQYVSEDYGTLPLKYIETSIGVGYETAVGKFIIAVYYQMDSVEYDDEYAQAYLLAYGEESVPAATENTLGVYLNMAF